MLTTIRLTGLTLCSGQTGTITMIVEQFGLAMMPLCSLMFCGLTSGTTSGTSGSMRKAEELSTTTAPACTAAGANSLLREAPAQNRAMSMPLKLSVVISSTMYSLPLKGIFLPAERLLASILSEVNGKFRSSIMLRNS